MHVPPKERTKAEARAARRAAPGTAGRAWFDLPATEITPAIKADLRMLHLRGALDSKTFYKKADSTKFPKYFQMGTVVAGAADFYSGPLLRPGWLAPALCTELLERRPVFPVLRPGLVQPPRAPPPAAPSAGRLTKRERKSSFAAEVGSDPVLAAGRKRRYTKMQAENEALSRKKKNNSRKTEKERLSKKPKKPRH